jgi:hypothetical protein
MVVKVHPGSLWAEFTPAEINPDCCQARTWANGKGAQCTRPKAEGSDFCLFHAKDDVWKVHGRVDGEIPEKKLQEFLRASGKGGQPKARAPKGPKDVVVIESARQMEDFKSRLQKKRVLHVKGFDSGFQDPSWAMKQLELKQDDITIKAMNAFRPDFLVVDGDPVGDGYQRHIKAFVDSRKSEHNKLPELIWVKSVSIDGVQAPAEEERAAYMEQAKEWTKVGMRVTVFWLANADVHAEINQLFGTHAWSTLEPLQPSERGALQMAQAVAAHPWLMELDNSPEGVVVAEAITAIEKRDGDTKHLQKRSFESVGQGNAIFRRLKADFGVGVQGVLCLGGEDGVLLQLASLYLNPSKQFSGDFDRSLVAVYPFERGGESDPALPLFEGSQFIGKPEAIVPQASAATDGAPKKRRPSAAAPPLADKPEAKESAPQPPPAAKTTPAAKKRPAASLPPGNAGAKKRPSSRS